MNPTKTGGVRNKIFIFNFEVPDKTKGVFVTPHDQVPEMPY